MKGSLYLNKSKNSLKDTNVLNTRPKVHSLNQVEEEYITNLEKHVYYLELQSKLLKEKEIESRNNLGGYEIMFRDGVPLNQHFMALKTKYNSEKEYFDKMINDLKNEVIHLEQENKYITEEIETSNFNYINISEKIVENSKFYKEKYFELSSKYLNENNTKELFTSEKEGLTKQLNRFSGENVHYNRTLEKNKLFKEDKEDKNKVIKTKTLENFNEIEKTVVKSLLEYQSVFNKFESNSKKAQIDYENKHLILILNKLERELHMGKAKLSELENNQTLNKKYLSEEEVIRRTHLKDNKKYNDELDNLTQMTDDLFKLKINEHVKNDIAIIQNTIQNNQTKLKIILNKYKEDESLAKDLLDEKIALTQKITLFKLDIENQEKIEKDNKYIFIDLKSEIQEMQIQLEENKIQVETVIQDNENLRKHNSKLENEILSIKYKIDEMKQKMELNNILKDIDIQELKQLSQNNALVNNTINSLMYKWDQAYGKLMEMEKQKNEY